MYSYEYPFFLVDGGHPYMKIGAHTVAVYWGAGLSYGRMDEIVFAGNDRIILHDENNEFYNLQHYTREHKIFTDMIAGWSMFWMDDFVIDLSREKLYVPSIVSHIGQRVALHKEHSEMMPLVEVEIDGNTYLMQVDIGDKISLVPPHVVAHRPSIGKIVNSVYGRPDRTSTCDIYEVPMKLSEKITINTIAQAIPPSDLTSFTATCTHGSIGVDLIRNHAVTFVSDMEDDPAMFFNSFQK